MEEQKRNPAQGLSESEQVQVRRQKLADLQAAGNDPFTLTKFPQDAYSADLKEEYKDLPNETDSGKHVALAGRMMSKRVMGKASFAHLRDDKGDIQLYVRRDELGEEAYAAFKKLDVGDIIGVKGEVFRTKTGELSVRATELTLLAKSLRPLPEKFHGLTDTEMRYRQRYVDLIANPEVKDTFVRRSMILRELRAFLDGKDANNILLYGDKGTGKSSTVKAVANEYADRGLKIIEMSPRHITNFPKLFEQTLRSPFRFIVFLDDLTFSSEDDNFAALKAFIEGGLAGKPSNLVIYATSNRRHLIRESMADRQGDEVRVRDTLETVTSLSDRFGLEITFSVPDKDEYLYIVEQLAKENDLNLDIDELHLLAERFALRRNGRSPRTARQFISQQLAEQYGK